MDFTLKATILICTPEKLSYIIHHQVEFLDEIGLYIFDESHMFDDGRRGTAYELLISEIRKHINEAIPAKRARLLSGHAAATGCRPGAPICRHALSE